MVAARQVPADDSEVTVVVATTDSQMLLAPNPLRRNFMVHNDSSAILYLTLGKKTSSASSFTVAMPANWYYEPPAPGWTGAVTGAWASAAGSAKITEVM